MTTIIQNLKTESKYAGYRSHFLGPPFFPLGWGPEMGQRYLAQNLSLVA